jgi:hypothetical protein
MESDISVAFHLLEQTDGVAVKKTIQIIHLSSVHDLNNHLIVDIFCKKVQLNIDMADLLWIPVSLKDVVYLDRGSQNVVNQLAEYIGLAKDLLENDVGF